MGSLLTLILVATPACQWKGTNWDPGEVVNAPDGTPLFELTVSFDRATARLGPESVELELENPVARLTGRLPPEAILSVAPRKPIELNAVMRLETGGWAFAGSRRGLVLPEELRRPDGSPWAPVAVACAQLELALGRADEDQLVVAARLLKAAPHVEEGFVFPGSKSVAEHQPLDFAARPGGPTVVRVMPLLPTLATVMAKKGAYTRLRFIVGGVRVDGWIRNNEDAFGGLALPEPPYDSGLMLDGKSVVDDVSTCQRDVPLSVARADGTVVPAGTLKRGARLSRKPGAQWVEITSDELNARPAAGGAWVLAPGDAERCPVGP